MSEVASSSCFHGHPKKGVFQHTDIQVETILTLEESCVTLCSTPLFLPRELWRWVMKMMGGEEELRLYMVSGFSNPQSYPLALCALLQGWGTAWFVKSHVVNVYRVAGPALESLLCTVAELWVLRVALVHFFFKADHYLCWRGKCHVLQCFLSFSGPWSQRVEQVFNQSPKGSTTKQPQSLIWCPGRSGLLLCSVGGV